MYSPFSFFIWENNMTLQTSGRISLSDVQRELSDTGSISLAEEMVRELAGDDDGGLISFSQLYGKSVSLGDYVWTSIPPLGNGASVDKVIPIAMAPGTRIMTVFRCGSAGNCNGNNYGSVTLPDYGITIHDGYIAGYWGGIGAESWGQWRIYTLDTAIPANATLRLTRSADGCGLIGSTQIYVASKYPATAAMRESIQASTDGWNMAVSHDYNDLATFEDFTLINYGSPPVPATADGSPGKIGSYGSVYWNFGGAAQTTRVATSSFDIKAGASCLIRGGFMKPGGNYNVAANIRVSTAAGGNFYEATIASWYGAHGGGSQPLAGYEFTAPFDIPKGTDIECYHYTNGQYGDGTQCDYVYLEVANYK
jgi:hypothetical protein